MICAALGAVIVAAAGLQGLAQFTGPRWVPTPPDVTHAPQAPDEVAPTTTSAPGPLPASDVDIAITAALVVVLIVIVVIVIAVLLWRIIRDHRVRVQIGLRGAEANGLARAPADEDEQIDAPSLRSGIDEALRILEEDREPDDAVIQAWLGMQRVAEESGVQRQAAETPTEFTRRIMNRVFTDDRAITTLLNLYLRTRFSDRPISPADVSRARDALQRLADTWVETAPAKPVRASMSRPAALRDTGER